MNASIPKVSNSQTSASDATQPAHLGIQHSASFFLCRSHFVQSFDANSFPSRGEWSQRVEPWSGTDSRASAAREPVEPVEGSRSRPDIKEVWRGLQQDDCRAIWSAMKESPYDDIGDEIRFERELESKNL